MFQKTLTKLRLAAQAREEVVRLFYTCALQGAKFQTNTIEVQYKYNEGVVVWK